MLRRLGLGIAGTSTTVAATAALDTSGSLFEAPQPVIARAAATTSAIVALLLRVMTVRPFKSPPMLTAPESCCLSCSRSLLTRT